ncbi:MAG: hypothetical protein WCB52_07675 [Pseudolabrys sp.]
MPVLDFLAAAGLALLALLFVADSMLEDSSPPIVTSSRVGLPKRWHQDTIKVLTTMPAPAPDMTSSAVRAAQPKSDPEALTKIDPAARAARAEMPAAHNAEVPAANNHVTPPVDYRQNRWSDRFSISGQ